MRICPQLRRAPIGTKAGSIGMAEVKGMAGSSLAVVLHFVSTTRFPSTSAEPDHELLVDFFQDIFWRELVFSSEKEP